MCQDIIISEAGEESHYVYNGVCLSKNTPTPGTYISRTTPIHGAWPIQDCAYPLVEPGEAHKD